MRAIEPARRTMLRDRDRANHWVAGLEVDAAWLEQRVVVELDSWRYHGGRWQFHRDRDRGLVLARAGYEVIRLTWRQLKRDRADVVETLAVVLARRSTGPR